MRRARRARRPEARRRRRKVCRSARRSVGAPPRPRAAPALAGAGRPRRHSSCRGREFRGRHAPCGLPASRRHGCNGMGSGPGSAATGEVRAGRRHEPRGPSHAPPRGWRRAGRRPRPPRHPPRGRPRPETRRPLRGTAVSSRGGARSPLTSSMALPPSAARVPRSTPRCGSSRSGAARSANGPDDGSPSHGPAGGAGSARRSVLRRQGNCRRPCDRAWTPSIAVIPRGPRRPQEHPPPEGPSPSALASAARRTVWEARTGSESSRRRAPRSRPSRGAAGPRRRCRC